MLLNSQVMGTSASRWNARRDVDAQTGQWKRCQGERQHLCCCSHKSQNSEKFGLRWVSQIHVRFLDELLSLTLHLIGRAVVVWSALRLNVGNGVWKKPQSSPSCEEPCEHGVVRDGLHRQVVHQSCTAILFIRADREGAPAGETSTDCESKNHVRCHFVERLGSPRVPLRFALIVVVGLRGLRCVAGIPDLVPSRRGPASACTSAWPSWRADRIKSL